jgi:hypothetical protein
MTECGQRKASATGTQLKTVLCLCCVYAAYKTRNTHAAQTQLKTHL